MVRLHELLIEGHQRQPNLLETMFSSHPMSTERRDTARRDADTLYAASARAPAGRERFMDRTASLRAIQPVIQACQRGEAAMARKAAVQAEGHFTQALQLSPRDYPALLRMAQCQHALGRSQAARRYVLQAREAYPQEAQAMKLAATLKLGLRDPSGALAELEAFGRGLRGDGPPAGGGSAVHRLPACQPRWRLGPLRHGAAQGLGHAAQVGLRGTLARSAATSAPTAAGCARVPARRSARCPR
jgi:tetratricopeptide (TPR) repeat protein